MMSQWQLPAVVALILTWLNAPAPSLGDLARREALRRQLTPASTHSLVNNDLPAGPGAAVSVPVSLGSDDDAKAAAAKGEDAGKDKKDEKYWRERMSQARTAVDRDRMMLEAMDSRINSLTTDFINRDDPAQKALIEQTRLKALAELDRLKKQLESDEAEIGNIQQEAHRNGVPPGWIR
jgi:hypothetical protein